ncbi:hypothetical protein FB451DRAFT_1215646 [Mycena latifolia]|nr:hypothetical protein FB451DRAFT_1215646 [Mycena latifolia]
MFSLFALLPLLAAAAHTAASPRQNTHIARQSSAADCVTTCKALTDSITPADGSTPGADGLASLCTNTIAGNYASCYSCEVSAAVMTQAQVQQTVDAYQQGCKASGHPVNAITISADGSSTASGGDASPAAPAASGASAPPSGKTSGSARVAAGSVASTAISAVLVFSLASLC